jgi:hypothetical protein
VEGALKVNTQKDQNSKGIQDLASLLQGPYAQFRRWLPRDPRIILKMLQ